MTSFRKRNAIIFGAIALVWLVFDQLTKLHFNSLELGQVAGGPYLGLFQFRLVHNTGAAWGMFSDSTFALGVVSLLVCLLLAVYLFVLCPRASVAQTVGLALVFSGGVGNAIDRFAQAYVVDFIDLTFMSFPVFNIADIGVTCGFVLFFISLLWEWRQESAAISSPNEEER